MNETRTELDALQDRSYVDRWGVRINIVWDAVRGQPPEEIARRRAKLNQVVQEMRLHYAQRMAAKQ